MSREAIKTISINSDVSFLPSLLSDFPPSWRWLKNKQIPCLMSRGTPSSPFLLHPGDQAGPHLHPGARGPHLSQVPDHPEQRPRVKPSGLPGGSPLPRKLRERRGAVTAGDSDPPNGSGKLRDAGARGFPDAERGIRNPGRRAIPGAPEPVLEFP